MNPSKHISVAMCTYNGERFLHEQLGSIASQTLLPSELLVCDDGSTDATAAIVAEFAQSAPFSVRFVQNLNNLGSTRNFEQAISLCRGEYIALSDQDDWWSPEKLEISVNTLRNSDAGGLFSDALLMNDASKPTGGRLWRAVRFDNTREILHFSERDSATATLLRGNVVTGATVVLRASLRELMLPFPKEWVHDGWMAWMLVLHARMIALGKPLIRYRVHSTQQVSIPARSLMAKLRRARESDTRDYRTIERQFQTLLEYASSHPETCSPELCRQIDEKRRHATFRASLRGSRWGRGKQIAGHIHAYRLYSGGWKSMLRDALI
jgi:glycosyltransferase involved in cell wall biosynthesis